MKRSYTDYILCGNQIITSVEKRFKSNTHQIKSNRTNDIDKQPKNTGESKCKKDKI